MLWPKYLWSWFWTKYLFHHMSAKAALSAGCCFYELIYYSDSQYSSLIKMFSPWSRHCSSHYLPSSVAILWSTVHAVTTYNSYQSGTRKFIKSDFNAEQLPLTLVTTRSHANLLSISPDVLKVNAAQELKAQVLHSVQCFFQLPWLSYGCPYLFRSNTLWSFSVVCKLIML